MNAKKQKRSNRSAPLLTCIFFLLMVGIPFISVSQEQTGVKYFGEEFFLLEGTQIADSLKENRYDRLPLSYKDRVREPVWKLSKNSAGLSVRFLTNSTRIHVKWTLLTNMDMNHMAETGIKGIDLYFKQGDNWQYLNTARPEDIENEYLLIENMAHKMREYRMYLPLYDGVKKIEVGIDAESEIRKPPEDHRGSIVFYGTSITQGGCASRPGMVHTSIISRKLNMDCVNFGFSGNGRMEQPIAELIAGFDPSFYVIECLPNMNAEQVTERTRPLVETLRKKHPDTPIVLVENFIYEPAALDIKMHHGILKKNEALQRQYVEMKNEGFSNIYYIEGHEATGNDHEGTVDGVHFTDLGFMRYADYLVDKFIKLSLIPGADD